MDLADSQPDLTSQAPQTWLDKTITGLYNPDLIIWISQSLLLHLDFAIQTSQLGHCKPNLTIHNLDLTTRTCSVDAVTQVLFLAPVWYYSTVLSLTAPLPQATKRWGLPSLKPAQSPTSYFNFLHLLAFCCFCFLLRSFTFWPVWLPGQCPHHTTQMLPQHHTKPPNGYSSH